MVVLPAVGRCAGTAFAQRFVRGRAGGLAPGDTAPVQLTTRRVNSRPFRAPSFSLRCAKWLSTVFTDLAVAEQRAREQLAKSLHDGLQQALFGAKLQVGQLAARQSGATDQVARLKQLEHDVDEAIAAARTLAVDRVASGTALRRRQARAGESRHRRPRAHAGRPAPDYRCGPSGGIRCRGRPCAGEYDEWLGTLPHSRASRPARRIAADHERPRAAVHGSSSRPHARRRPPRLTAPFAS